MRAVFVVYPRATAMARGLFVVIESPSSREENEVAPCTDNRGRSLGVSTSEWNRPLRWQEREC